MEHTHQIWSDIDKRLKKQCSNTSFDECWVWMGVKTYKTCTIYGKMRARLPGDDKSKYYYIHRLSYMCHHQQILNSKQFISHLCHNSLCFNPAHLVIEDISSNHLRKACRQFGHCTGHHPEPRCIL